MVAEGIGLLGVTHLNRRWAIAQAGRLKTFARMVACGISSYTTASGCRWPETGEQAGELEDPARPAVTEGRVRAYAIFWSWDQGRISMPLTSTAGVPSASTMPQPRWISAAAYIQ